MGIDRPQLPPYTLCISNTVLHNPPPQTVSRWAQSHSRPQQTSTKKPTPGPSERLEAVRQGKASKWRLRCRPRRNHLGETETKMEEI